jgi:hypothetical protein
MSRKVLTFERRRHGGRGDCNRGAHARLDAACSLKRPVEVPSRLHTLDSVICSEIVNRFPNRKNLVCLPTKSRLTVNVGRVGCPIIGSGDTESVSARNAGDAAGMHVTPDLVRRRTDTKWRWISHRNCDKQHWDCNERDSDSDYCLSCFHAR